MITNNRNIELVLAFLAFRDLSASQVQNAARIYRSIRNSSELDCPYDTDVADALVFLRDHELAEVMEVEHIDYYHLSEKGRKAVDAEITDEMKEVCKRIIQSLIESRFLFVEAMKHYWRK